MTTPGRSQTKSTGNLWLLRLCHLPVLLMLLLIVLSLSRPSLPSPPAWTGPAPAAPTVRWAWGKEGIRREVWHPEYLTPTAYGAGFDATYSRPWQSATGVAARITSTRNLVLRVQSLDYKQFNFWPALLQCLPLSIVGAIGEVVLRRKRRMKQGLCRHCGYDLRATPDRCPECGKGYLTSQERAPNSR